MDSLSNTLFLSFFLIGLLLFLLFARGGLPSTVRALVANTRPAKWQLNDFVNGRTTAKIHRKYLFTEQIVTNMSQRYRGRFDHAIIRMEEGPVLEAVIEFKFPQQYIPYKIRKEDIFQAGLYALALRDMGVSTRNTTLLILYCLQDVAQQCDRPSIERCLFCPKGKRFRSEFRPYEVEKELEQMNSYWKGEHRPIPSPSKENCKRCPYSAEQCQYSAV